MTNTNKTTITSKNTRGAKPTTRSTPGVKSAQSARRPVRSRDLIWKNIILATSLVGTLYGWILLSNADAAASSTSTPQVVAQNSNSGFSSGNAQSFNTGASNNSQGFIVPNLPQQPIFQGPIVRTRRS